MENLEKLESKIWKFWKIWKTWTQILNAFQRDDLLVFTDPIAFQDYLFEQDFNNTSLLLMSSGNYGGLDFEKVKGILK